jgi:hypothetical protein
MPKTPQTELMPSPKSSRPKFFRIDGGVVHRLIRFEEGEFGWSFPTYVSLCGSVITSAWGRRYKGAPSRTGRCLRCERRARHARRRVAKLNRKR